ncbi:MAG: restriction endonuclease subunit S [Clostridia bacterium]|nr:restriction endonuclease subunit S [Clostridia bacterium]
MTPEELKKSILQLAIQGKLVEQRPEEGTADDLYAQIQAEKQRLIKEGKIKKEKPLPEIAADDIPFDIPDSWKWVRLSKVGITQTGNTPKKAHPEYFGDYIPFLGPGDIQNGIVNYHNQGLSAQGIEYGRLAKVNSVLQVCIGGSIGKAALINRDVTFNQQINAITPILCNPSYIYFVLVSSYFIGFMKEHSGGTATPIINRSLWDEIVIPFPPLNEQVRIVSKIEGLLPLVDKYADAYNRLEELNKTFPGDLKKSILQYAIQGKLVEQRPEEGTADDLYAQIQTEKQRLIKEGKIKKEKPLPEITDDEIPFDIPESWKWVRFSNVISLLSGADLSPSKYNSEFKGIPYLTGASNIENKKVLINRWTEYPNNIAVKGNILLTCKGTVGKTAILCEDKVHIARQIMAITSIGIDSEYAEFFVQSQIDFLKSLAKSMIPGIERSNVLNLCFPLPPLQEQKRIVVQIKRIYQVLNL